MPRKMPRGECHNHEFEMNAYCGTITRNHLVLELTSTHKHSLTSFKKNLTSTIQNVCFYRQYFKSIRVRIHRVFHILNVFPVVLAFSIAVHNARLHHHQRMTVICSTVINTTYDNINCRLTVPTISLRYIQNPKDTFYIFVLMHAETHRQANGITVGN